MIKEIIAEDLREYIRDKKIFYVLAIILFIILIVYASGFLQVGLLIFFKPSNIVPFPISITYYLLFITIPILAVLLGHDAISSEIENQHIRCIISKISRNSFILGKFISLLIIMSSLILLLLLSATLYSFARFHQFYSPLIFFFYLVFYSAGICAIVICFSSLFSKISTALFAKLIFFLILLYFSTIQLEKISIFHYMNNVFSLEFLPMIIFSIYLLIFLSCSLLIFRVRDL